MRLVARHSRVEKGGWSIVSEKQLAGGATLHIALKGGKFCCGLHT